MKTVNRQGRDPAQVIGLVVSIALLLATGAVLLAKIRGTPKRPMIVSFTKDWSHSTPPRNQCLERTANAAISRASDRVEIIYTRTGDDQTAFEPVQPVQPFIVRKTDVPWGAGPKGIQKLVDQFLFSVARSSSAKRSWKSPIFIAVDRSVSDLRMRDDAERVAIIESDLEDNASPALVQAFHEKPGTKLKGLPKIDNKGISVRFVATEDTIGFDENTKGSFTATRTPERIRRLQEVWKACFTDPDLVTFTSSCNNPLP